MVEAVDAATRLIGARADGGGVPGAAEGASPASRWPTLSAFFSCLKPPTATAAPATPPSSVAARPCATLAALGTRGAPTGAVPVGADGVLGAADVTEGAMLLARMAAEGPGGLPTPGADLIDGIDGLAGADRPGERIAPDPLRGVPVEVRLVGSFMLGPRLFERAGQCGSRCLQALDGAQ